MISRGEGSFCEIQTDTRHSDQISRSTRRDGATKKNGMKPWQNKGVIIFVWPIYILHGFVVE